MINLEMIRHRCRELLILAELENNQEKQRKLLECEQRLRDDDCFSNPRKRSGNYFLLFERLGFSIDEAYEFVKYMENASKAHGVLFRKRRDGGETPVETILNPEIEDYFQFENGTVFKIRNETDFYYLDSNGKWIYDADLERKFVDPQYSYQRIRYQITQSSVRMD